MNLRVLANPLKSITVVGSTLVLGLGIGACASSSTSDSVVTNARDHAITNPGTVSLVAPPVASAAKPAKAAKLKAASVYSKAKAGATPPTGKRVIGYYPNYKMYNGYEPGQIPAKQLTAVNYAFAYIANGGNYFTDPTYYPLGLPQTGTCAASDVWGDQQKDLEVNGTTYKGGYAALNQGVRAENPDLKTFLSIGGFQQIVGNQSDKGDVPWTLVTKDEASMQKFVDSCVSLAWNNGFDGIDLDWEFPSSPADQTNLVKLLQKFRAKLGGAPLTFAGGPDPAKVQYYGGAEAVALVDWVNVMAYDFFGPWPGTATTDMNAPLAHNPADPNAQAAQFNDTILIGTYVSAGFPAGKLILGVPFYGHTFSGVPTTNNGLFQSWTSPGPAGPISQQPGSLTYAEIVDNYGSVPVFQDTASSVPYKYDAATGLFISYDDATSIGVKSSFAKNNSLGGAMIWDLSSDATVGGVTLLDSINTNL